MKEHRHPHPHIDPRQPRDGTRPGTNPPVFAWKPVPGDGTYTLTVARDPGMQHVCLREEAGQDPVHLPTQAFAPGVYYWQWARGDCTGETFRFEVTREALVLEVPAVEEWLRRFPAEHPRLYVRPEQRQALRESRHGTRAAAWSELEAAADELLSESHEIPEPPFLPDRRQDYSAFYETWAPIMWDSRRFVKGAEILALAYLASGDERYGRAACERMASISRWDPEGSSHLAHNDEAHMSVIWHGAKACDWVWELFTAEEKSLVIDQFRKRGQITYEYMHDHGCYGVTRFDSHAGREIVFLALLALVFGEHIPQATTWLDWLRPILCGIWPVWAGDDGAWAEGPSYGLAYVTIMTMFATCLKQGTGVDLYRRPFWRNHALWRKHCWPFYAEWIGFGDHSERWRGSWQSNARLVEIIGAQTGDMRCVDYVEALRQQAESLPVRGIRGAPEISAQSYLAQEQKTQSTGPPESPVLRVFPATGRAAIRTDLADASRDIALVFRSSPYGAISHSHAGNNDFILHVAGRAMAMPSGYYDGYGSDHHTHWVWHTKSHNCVTLSDAGQIMRSHDSRGAVENAFEDDRLTYFTGRADASYADRAERCRRHVLFLKSHCCFVMIDEFTARPGIVSCLQWNIHSWDRFTVDEQQRTFALRREASSLQGHFMHHHNGFFSLSEGWDPPPKRAKPSEQWYHQYHLRFTASGLYSRCVLGVVLAPGHTGLRPAEVTTERNDGAEIAHIGSDIVMTRQGETMHCRGVESQALACAIVAGQRYDIDDRGVHLVS